MFKWFNSRKARPAQAPAQAEEAHVKERWGSGPGASAWRSPHRRNWTHHPKVQERLNLMVSGSPIQNRFEYFMARYLAGRMPVARALTLGCGHGELERGLAQYNFASSHEGLDIADAAIADATKLAADAGISTISYKVADLNSIVLPKETYDVVFGVGSIHHTTELEHVFDQVSKTLKPGGFFFLDEFIGPSQFQWSTQQLAIINAEIEKLPAEYRVCVDDPQQIKPLVHRLSLEEMNAVDPSEAIRSQEIVELLPRYFNVLETRGAGGSLLHMLLDRIAGNFDENEPEGMSRLQSFFDLEDRMIASGDLQHDFAVIIASKH